MPRVYKLFLIYVISIIAFSNCAQASLSHSNPCFKLECVTSSKFSTLHTNTTQYIVVARAKIPVGKIVSRTIKSSLKNGAKKVIKASLKAVKKVGKGIIKTLGSLFKKRVQIKPKRGAANPAVQKALIKGRKMHAKRKYPPGFKKEYTLPSGKRMDAYNKKTKTVIELKPNNKAAIKKGKNQLKQYCKECDNEFGAGHKGKIETYN